MSRFNRPISLWGKLAAAGLLSVALVGCGGGSDGAAGPAGPTGATGPAGPAGPAGTDLTKGAVSALRLTADDLKNKALDGKIISVDTSGDQPIVNFQVKLKATGEGVSGLATFALHIAQLQPEKNGSASYWLSYLAEGLPLTAMPANVARGGSTPIPVVDPVADATTLYKADGTVQAQGYTVTDKGDGNYSVKFGANIKANTKVIYDPKLVHRVVVGVRSVAVPGVVGKTPGAYAGPINPLTGLPFAAFTNTNGTNFAFDFTPAAAGVGAVLTDSAGKQTYARDNVTMASCNDCHYKLEYGFPRGNNTSGHFGSRTDTKTCVMCHTPQLRGGKGDFTVFIHKIHMGEELKKPEAEFWSTALYNEFKNPQNPSNCVKCHTGTVPESQNKVTLKACGSCHNGVDFASGVGHGVGGPRVDDLNCANGCHDKAGLDIFHKPVKKVASTNVPALTSYYANPSMLPKDAFDIKYVIKSVTVDAERKVSVAFQITKNGAAVNFGTYNATTNPNIIPGTVGGPSIRIAYNVTQDGIKSPADFNAYMTVPGLGIAAPSVPAVATAPGVLTPASTASSIWANPAGVTVSGVTWTLSAPDAANTYTIKSSLPLPAESNMVTAFFYGAMTQTNLAAFPFSAASVADFSAYPGTGSNAGKTAYELSKKGLILGIDNAKLAVTSTGFTARRTIVDNAKCEKCHSQLGLQAGGSAFHGGGRNDGTACNICHTPNGVNKGWSYSFNTFVHGIHGASMRSKPYTFTEDWSTVGYPGLLKNCEQCHVSGSYDFSATANATAATGKLLYNTVANGTAAAVADATTSPYIVPGTVYGSGFSYSTATGAVVATQAADTTLVSSPIAAACFSCHDSDIAKGHMRANEGSIYEPRSLAKQKTETCLVCHGPAAGTASFNDTVPTIKAVHRWW